LYYTVLNKIDIFQPKGPALQWTDTRQAYVCRRTGANDCLL